MDLITLGDGFTLETWKRIPEFPNYEISNLGNVYNRKRSCLMSTSLTQKGHVKISLMSDRLKDRRTMSVALLVAEAFVEPDNLLCDQVVVLDGNFQNVAAENLRWRPKWFAWKYTHQLKTRQPLHYCNLPVVNIDTDEEHDSIIDAGIKYGLLFEDVWRSTFSGTPIYPYRERYEILERV